MQLSSLVLMTLGELLLVTTIASILMLVLAVVRKRRDRSAAGALIGRIKEDQGRRETETRELLEQNFGLDGKSLETLVKRIGREEKRFYQTLINLYLKRDAGALQNLQVTFEGATDPYRGLEIPKVESGDEIVPAVMEPETQDDSAEVARLKGENERLSEELRITMDTMGRMLSEYSSMYAGGSGDQLDKEKMLEMFRADAINARAREKQTTSGQSTSAAVEVAAGPADAVAALQDGMSDLAGGGLLAGSGMAGLQSKMDDLDKDLAAATGSGNSQGPAAEDLAAEDEGFEIVPVREAEDDLDETELIDLDAVLEQRV